ncbi:hypothetical protein ACFOOP_05770 [Marinicaulis aureus]|uniref:Uncharacterized protein n=1 Tax=Hyphococcus aureus TaxID=2666033 RepID=A0ABW1KXI7_9PROT
MTRPKTRQESLEEKEYLGEPGAPSQGGVSGGDLQEKIGKKDEEKRASERPAGVTRVRKSDEKE